jgi:hypothetical protein
VRHLVIGPFRQRKNIPSVGKIEHILLLSSFHMLTKRKLKAIRWAVQFAIPEDIDILNMFHARWLSDRLHVSNTDRINRSLPLDTALLSSPQLHSLHLSIHGHRIGVTYTSKLAMLSSSLLPSKSLESLRLR